jgi:predicted small lipoprotein YifL
MTLFKILIAAALVAALAACGAKPHGEFVDGAVALEARPA